MKIIKLTNKNHEPVIKEVQKVLASGGLVVFPTDTVYGLLADSTNPLAVDKLLKFKDRPVGKAVSVFVADKFMASKYVEITINANNIINNLLPGPFTVICKYHSNREQLSSRVPMSIGAKDPVGVTLLNGGTPLNGIHRGKALLNDNLTVDPRLLAENGTLGFRIPDFPIILELVKKFGRPVTATSANLSGTSPHYSIPSFLKSLTTQKSLTIDLIVDGGKLPYNKPSTVIDTTTGQLKTLRFGNLLPNTANSLISRSEKQTKELAQFILTKMLGKSTGKPLVFLLEGNLGAGKTIFTKGLGKALGIKEEIVSPTYTISYEYPIGNNPVGAIHESPASHRTSRCDIGAPLHYLSTKNPDLSTSRPIDNGYISDMDRLCPNTNFVQQMRKLQNQNAANVQFPIPDNKSLITNYKLLITNHYLVHYDLYRIETNEDLKEIGFLESIVPGNIYSVEWPERIDRETLVKLKEKAYVVYIKINHLSPKERSAFTKASSRQREISWSN